MRQIPLAQSGKRFDRRGRTEALQPEIEVALHPVLERDRAILVAPLRMLRAGAVIEEREVVLWILVHVAGDIGGIDDGRSVRLQNSDRIGHRLSLLGVDAATWSAFSWKGHALVVERARNADARAFQSIGVQEFGVVAAWRRRARPGRRIIR